jgi:hypothetical protein
MNGNVVKVWEGLTGQPVKMLPDGYVYGSVGGAGGPGGGMPGGGMPGGAGGAGGGMAGGGMPGGAGGRGSQQSQAYLSLVDWDGNIVWQLKEAELTEGSDDGLKWYNRFHHDYQIEGNPTGYYVPGTTFNKKGNMLILSNENVNNPEISANVLQDDLIVEINNKGEILWQWLASDHFDEFGFDYDAQNAIYRKGGDWMHVNSMSWVGPNKWYDQGDERFHPENIIIDGRETNIIAIIDKTTGNIVYQIGPDYTSSPALRKLGQIIGQHHAHIIPRGLPGEGNLLIFDNGGNAGYGAPTSQSPMGNRKDQREYSRVIEIDPITLEIVWEMNGRKLGYSHESHFFSFNISCAQRLLNGNTLVTEGAEGRLLEVTPDFEIVWEYINPDARNSIYRAYRVPYDWVPQLPGPEEKAITPPANGEFHVPGSSPKVLEDAVTELKDKSGP